MLCSSAPTQRAVVVRRHGGPEVLELSEDWPVPSLEPDEVLVRNSIAGINYIDTYFREGKYPSSPPYVAGLEGAGVVVNVGKEAESRISIGARVAYPRSRTGSYAEYAAVNVSLLVQLPEGVSFGMGATAMIQGLTAHYLACSAFPAGPGTRALVHAAAGGTGLALVQALKARGATVVGTTSTVEKAHVAQAAGADHIVIHGRDAAAEAWLQPALAASGGPFDVAYDGIGRSTFRQSWEAVRARGTVVLFGAASGQPDPVAIPTMTGSKYLVRPSLWDFVSGPGELDARASEVFGWLGKGQLDLSQQHTEPLEQAAALHRRLEASASTGKLLLSLEAETVKAEL
jgi:NADPH2:quinone reductase